MLPTPRIHVPHPLLRESRVTAPGSRVAEEPLLRFETLILIDSVVVQRGIVAGGVGWQLDREHL